MAEQVEAKTEKKKEKKKFQMPNTYVILFVIIGIIALLTWFVPGGAYDLTEGGDAIAGTYHVVESNPQGIWDIFMAPVTGMLGSATVDGAIAISLTILLFGSLLEMMDKTCALKIAIKRITNANKNNMNVLIAILVIIMSFFGTLEGAYEEGIVYFLMFVPVILALGLDTVTAILIVVLGTQVGCISSVVNPFATGIASGIAGISPGEGMLERLVMFVLFDALAILLICRYANRVKKHPEKSVQFFRREQDLQEFPAADDEDLTLTGRQKGALALFILTFVFMIIGLTPWTSLNPDWTFFDDFVAWVAATPIIRNILGTDMTAFGNWYFPELSMITLVMVILIGVVMRYNADEIIDTILKGAAGLVSTAFVVPLARGIQVVMDNGQITPSILHACEGALASLPPVAFVIVALVCYFLIACLIPSSTGLAAATMGIMGTLATFANVDVYIMVIIYLMALGLAKMITPCSIVVMTCTSAAHMSYGDWVKQVAPMVGILFLVCCVFLSVLVLI